MIEIIVIAVANNNFFLFEIGFSSKREYAFYDIFFSFFIFELYIS